MCKYQQQVSDSPNIHNEDFVYAQFLLENYHDLPRHRVFVHPEPQVQIVGTQVEESPHLRP